MTLPERALSLTQPWAYFMLELPFEYRKRVENRSQGFSHKSFRGEVWVHATKGFKVRDWDAAMLFAREQGVPESLLPTAAQLHYGAIVGRFTITGQLPATRVVVPGSWRMVGKICFPVENAVVVPPVKVAKGNLGFWRVKPETLALLQGKGP